MTRAIAMFALIALGARLSSVAQTAPPTPGMFPPSPKATNMPHHVVYPTPPPAKTNVLISWNFPVAAETSDLIFKLYYSPNPAAPVPSWPCIATAPRSARSIVVLATAPKGFFALTASNSAGESKYATK